MERRKGNQERTNKKKKKKTRWRGQGEEGKKERKQN